MEHYFELYEIPVSFTPDSGTVKRKFYELSRKFHPDRFAGADEHEQQTALEQTTLNNKAFKVLSNHALTFEYILKLKGIIVDDEKFALPPAFLAEMMDLNEAISDFEDDPDNQQLKTNALAALTGQLDQWQAACARLQQKCEADNYSSESLTQLKEMYYRQKYLLRIKERLV